MGFDLISSSIFLCQGKLIMFSIIRVSGNSLQLLWKASMGSSASLGSLVSLCFLLACSFLVYHLDSHFYLFFMAKGVLGHPLRHIWRTVSISKSTEAYDALPSCFHFFQEYTFFFSPFKTLVKATYPGRTAITARKWCKPFHLGTYAR